MKRTAKARAKAPKASKGHPFVATFRETTPLLLALAVVDERDSVDAKGNVIESIWLTMAKDQLSHLSKIEGADCLEQAEMLLALMTAWRGEK
jgi:hypothetical protein